MFKHIFWGVVVLLLAVIGGYVALTVAGYSDQANALGGGAVLLAAFFCFMLGSSFY